MSRPRKPFGATHPGRLPATMMKVLAAEMSDPSRLRRGKQYAKDGSVLDIDIQPGVVTCEVQGSRPTPYIAAIEVTPGDGMPLRRDVTVRCTCPDSDNWDGLACKHALAAMFTFSDELLLEPELLDVWRNRSIDRTERADHDGTDGRGEIADTTPPASTHRGSHRHLRVVRPGERPPAAGPEREPEPTSRLPDPVDALLAAPAGHPLPDVPTLDPIDPVLPRRPELAAVIRDALRHVHVEWD